MFDEAVVNRFFVLLQREYIELLYTQQFMATLKGASLSYTTEHRSLILGSLLRALAVLTNRERERE